MRRIWRSGVVAVILAAAWDATVPQIVAGLSVIFFAALAGGVYQVFRTSKKMEAHVLPHFTAPTADEIRSNPLIVDNTLPARLARAEAATVTQKNELSAHLIDETKAAAEMAERDRQRDQHIAQIDAAVAEVVGAVQQVDAKLDATLAKLEAGHPEIRP